MFYKFLLSMAICRIVILIKEILDVEHIEGGVVYY